MEVNIKYDFIEIGTSDFRTLIETTNEEVGLSIEPIKKYLDNLPIRNNVTKVNYGVSNFNGTTKIYYVTPENILKYNLPNWVRGCNSINTPHPTVKKLLKEKHDNIVTIETIKIVNWKTLITEFNIGGVKLLKIDTEGHDIVILNDYYDNCLINEDILADIIIFEYNELTDKESANELIDKFKTLGYNGSVNGFDYHLIKIIK